MAFVTTGVGANSYLTLEDATNIATDYGFNDWLNFDTNTQPESILTTASLVLNTLSYSGARVDTSQVLQFPRRGYYTVDDTQVAYPTDGSGNYIVPMAVKRAAMYQAEYLLKNPNILFTEGGVTDAAIGDLEVKGIIAPGQIPAIVYQLLSPYTSGGAGTIDSHLIQRTW